MMPRKNRADSIAESVKASQASGRAIEPPSNVPLTDAELPFFANVLDEFARDEWTAHSLECAAFLARTMAALEEQQRLLRQEGYIAKRENGTTVENPRARAAKSLTGDILAHRRSLSLHARAKAGEARDIGKRRSLQKASEIEDDDDYLARPN
jgi:hypothetical protein